MVRARDNIRGHTRSPSSYTRTTWRSSHVTSRMQRLLRWIFRICDLGLVALGGHEGTLSLLYTSEFAGGLAHRQAEIDRKRSVIA
jgi:hypothetical protein